MISFIECDLKVDQPKNCPACGTPAATVNYIYKSEEESSNDKIRSFLKPDGLVLMVVPNIDCLGRRLFETNWAWILPWHCNFFNPSSAQRLLAGQGFDVLNSYLKFPRNEKHLKGIRYHMRMAIRKRIQLLCHNEAGCGIYYMNSAR